MPGNGFGDGNGFHTRFALQSIVEAAQKLAPRLRIIFPGILAIENDGHQSVPALVQDRLRCLFNVLNEMIGRVLRCHSGIYKADQIRDGMVAENQVHLRLIVLVAMDGIELFRQLPVQPSATITSKIQSQTPPQHAFIRGHPLDTQILGNAKNFFGDAAFRRPHTLGPDTKDLLVKIEAALELFPRILRMTKTVLRKRQSGTGNGPHVRIADQGQNGVVERRSGDFNSTMFCRVRMCRKHLGQQLAFALDRETLVFQRVVAAFLDQLRNLRIVEKEFVEPCNLREHLQIGKVLGLKIFLGPLRRITCAPESFPQFLIARVTAYQMDWVGLEQILQCEMTLVECEVVGRLGRHLQERVLGCPSYIILNLQDKRRNQIEILVDVGELVQQLDHSVIIFERVQPDPGKAIFACNQVFIKRLVLVPQDNYAQDGHELIFRKNKPEL